ncbi:MAG: antitoxin family protein [Armatimonadota bacterium]|nr:antitoxin family protein [Armatimonadota bacterium]
MKTTIRDNGTLTLQDLPFREGEAVEVIILETASLRDVTDNFPLRGMLRRYNNPFAPIAQEDWIAAA